MLSVTTKEKTKEKNKKHEETFGVNGRAYYLDHSDVFHRCMHMSNLIKL